jgi:hypothetical protein
MSCLQLVSFPEQKGRISRLWIAKGQSQFVVQMEDKLSITLLLSLHHSHFAFIIGDAEHLCSQRTTKYQ